MRKPRTVEGFLDATVSRLDDLGGNFADEGIECLCADGIYDAFADFLRVKPTRLEAFGQGRIFIGANFRPALWSGRLRAPRGILVSTGPRHSRDVMHCRAPLGRGWTRVWKA